MIGTDLFFKGLEACFKVAEKGMESSFKMIAYLSGIPCGSRVSKSEEKETESRKQETESKVSSGKPVTEKQGKPETEKVQKTASKTTVKPAAEPPPPKQVKAASPPKPAPKPKTKKELVKPKVSKPKAKKKPSKAKTPPKSPPVKSQPPAATNQTATDVVRDLIFSRKGGVKLTEIQEETGFDSKKIQNIIYKLKKRKR